MTTSQSASLACCLAGSIAIWGLSSGCVTVEGNERVTDRYLGKTAAAQIDQLGETREVEIAASQSAQATQQTPAVTEEKVDEPAELELDLAKSLELALTRSRQYLTRREEVDLSALTLRDAEHLFEPQLTSSLSALYNDGRNTSRVFGQGGAVGISQALPFGGELELRALSDTTQRNPQVGATDQGTVNRVLAGITQPLLRGAGYEVSHEPLTQAQRNLIYAVRDFELFRQDLAISTLRSFYLLVQGRTVLVNAEANFKTSSDLLRQSEGLYSIGTASLLDVLRAEEQKLEAENSVIDARESYESDIGTFKVLLDIPDLTVVTVKDDKPVFIPLEVDVNAAIQQAFELRLDYRTELEGVEDSERTLRIAANNLLPDVELAASVNLGTDSDDALFTSDFKERNWTMGANVELPVDRVRQRNTYRAARIRAEQAHRQLELYRDNLANDVRATVRGLRRAATALAIQERLLKEHEKRLRVALLRYDKGELENRDVVEATNAVNEAQNSVVRNLLQYEIARIQLKRDIGTLIVMPDGRIAE